MLLPPYPSADFGLLSSAYIYCPCKNALVIFCIICLSSMVSTVPFLCSHCPIWRTRLDLILLWVCFIYLGFGAGFSSIYVCWFVKTIPLEIIAFANYWWLQSASDIFPMLFCLLWSQRIFLLYLETMRVWNDYLPPYLVLIEPNSNHPNSDSVL